MRARRAGKGRPLTYGQPGPLTKHDLRTNYTYRGGEQAKPEQKLLAVSLDQYAAMRGEKEKS